MRIGILAQRYVYGRRNTRGLLQRRRVDLAGPPWLIGKEANKIDEVQASRYAQLDEITEYHDPADDHFHRKVIPVLDHLSGRELARLAGAIGAPLTESAEAKHRNPNCAKPSRNSQSETHADRTIHHSRDQLSWISAVRAPR